MPIPQITHNGFLDLRMEHAYQQYQLPQFHSLLDYNYNKFNPSSGSDYSSSACWESLFAKLLLWLSISCLVYYSWQFSLFFMRRYNKSFSKKNDVRDLEAQLQPDVDFNFQRRNERYDEDMMAPELSLSSSTTPEFANSPRLPQFELPMAHSQLVNASGMIQKSANWAIRSK